MGIYMKDARLFNVLTMMLLLLCKCVADHLMHPCFFGWKGFNPRYKPVDSVQEERKCQNKERTLMEYKKLEDKILKRDQKRRKRIEAAGIEYECPEIVGRCRFYRVGSHPSETTSVIGASVDKRITLR
ncbi:hypothetical protein EZV62_025237 [Acer yangbiense]|uniref:Uncharacterized protein n=1 Tax=Acer yangbiense TaxID=1000413 RepID=A0A5C7GYH5_9ROSI|nr:hypothetical protein EZV62_025237 [Acer yangbiense]